MPLTLVHSDGVRLKRKSKAASPVVTNQVDDNEQASHRYWVELVVGRSYALDVDLPSYLNPENPMALLTAVTKAERAGDMPLRVGYLGVFTEPNGTTLMHRRDELLDLSALSF